MESGLYVDHKPYSSKRLCSDLERILRILFYRPLAVVLLFCRFQKIFVPLQTNLKIDVWAFISTKEKKERSTPASLRHGRYVSEDTIRIVLDVTKK